MIVRGRSILEKKVPAEFNRRTKRPNPLSLQGHFGASPPASGSSCVLEIGSFHLGQQHPVSPVLHFPVQPASTAGSSRIQAVRARNLPKGAKMRHAGRFAAEGTSRQVALTKYIVSCQGGARWISTTRTNGSRWWSPGSSLLAVCSCVSHWIHPYSSRARLEHERELYKLRHTAGSLETWDVRMQYGCGEVSS